MNFFLENSNFSSNFIFSHTAQFLSKINNFFSSESWNIILYCRQILLVNAPIFWRVSSFEALLTNKKIAFWNQIQKMARFSSLWVGWSFWHYHCKERPIFDLGLAWFAFITRKTTSTEKKPKKKHSGAEMSRLAVSFSIRAEQRLLHSETKAFHRYFSLQK